jgi:DNA-binding PadR family transcriptional regulator
MVSQDFLREVGIRVGGRRKRRGRKIYEITMKGESAIRYFEGAKGFQLEDIDFP